MFDLSRRICDHDSRYDFHKPVCGCGKLLFSSIAYWKARAALSLFLVLFGIFTPVKADDGVLCPNLNEYPFTEFLEIRCLGYTDSANGQKNRNSGFHFGEGYPAKFTFTRKGNLSEPLTIEYETTIHSGDDPHAVAGSDYTSVGGTLNFAADDRVAQSFEIPISEDSTYEATEYFGLKITVKVNNVLKGTKTKEITIFEKQSRTITISPGSPIGIPETAGSRNKPVIFTLDDTVPHEITISWTLYDSEHRTATVAEKRGGDMAQIDIVRAELQSSLTFPANTRSVTGYLEGINDDNIPEPDEQFALTFGNQVGSNNKPIRFVDESNPNSTVSPATRSFTIKDDDTVTGPKSAIVYLHGRAPIDYFPVVNDVFPSTQTEITEGNGTTITATLKGAAPAQNLTIPLKWTGFPSTANSDDFDLPATITIRAGETSGTANLTVKNDSVDERHYELLAIEIDESKLDSNYERGDRNRFEVIMIDANKTPVKLRGLSSSEIAENAQNPNLTFEIEMARPPNGPVTNSENAPFTVVLDEGQPKFELKFSKLNNAKGGLGTDFTAKQSVDGSACAKETDSILFVCRVTISIKDDDLWERDETFRVNLDFTASKFTDGIKAATGHAPLDFTIKDDETQPKFSIEAATATEGSDLVFKVKRTGALGNRISVRAKSKDDTGANHAVAGKDYTANTETLEFGSGVTTKDFSVTSLQDILDEANETFLVALDTPKALDGLPPPAIETGEASGTINDDDDPPTAITITVDTDSSTPGDQVKVDEADGDVSVNVTAEITSPTRFSTDKIVVISVGDSPNDSSAEGADYASVTDFNLTIPAEQSSVVKAFTLKLSNDDIYELDETISVTGTLDGVTVTPATITINDNEAKPTVTLSLTDASIVENGGSTNVKATLSGEASEKVELTVTAAALAPAVNSDFMLSAAKTLTIAASQTASTETVTITAVNNDIDADNKKVSVSAIASGGHDVADPDPVALTIEDDDTRGVTLSAEPPIEIWESDDPDTNPVESTKNEYTIVLDSEPTGDVTVNLKSSEATSATVTPTEIKFTPSNWNNPRTITISAVDDNIDNTGDERTTVISHTIAGSGTDYADLTIDPIEVTVKDEDAAPSSIILAIDVSADEGAQNSVVEDSGKVDVTVTATISGETRFAKDQAITIAVERGETYPATVNTDYDAVSEFDIVLLAGTASREGEFELTLKDDEIDERNETISVTGQLAGVTVEPATITITDNEDTPKVTLILSHEKVTEDGGTTSGRSTVSASMSGTSSEAVTLAVSATPQLHATASDITLSSNTTLTIAADAKTSTGLVTITAQANRIDTLDKTFKVSAEVTGGIGVSDPDDKTLTIEDDDERGVTVSESKVPLRETDEDENDATTDNEKSYTVQLNSQPASGSVSITVKSADESVATVDKGTLSFTTSNWNQPQTVTIEAVNDNIDNNGDERKTNISHTLSTQGEGNDYVGVTADSIEVTVQNDDAAPTAMTITVDTNTATVGNQVTVAENFGRRSVRLTVAIDGVTRFDDDVTVAVTFGTDDDSATETVDYTAADLNIKILKGSASASETFTLTVVDDDLDEPDEETFSVAGSLDGVDGVTISGTAITIEDNETKPTVSLNLSKSKVTEADESVTVTANLTGKSSEDVTLTVAAAAGTRASTDDFELSENATLTIAAGKTTSTGTVTISTVDNDVDTENKSVTVSATVVGGNDIAKPADVDLTIEDDDTRGVDISESSATVNEQDIPDTPDNTDKEHQKTYEVVLLSEPTGEVIINVASADTTIATVDSMSLTFDADDWDDPQTVTIEAVDDNIDNSGDKRQTEITHTVSAAGTDYSSVTASGIAVTVNDNEGTPVVSLTLSETSIDENGGTTSGISTITASMNGTSSQVVTLTISASPEHAGDSSAFTITANKTLTIAAGAQTSTGTVTISAVDNEVHDADKKITVSAVASGGNGVAHPANAELKIVNDDVRGVMVSQTKISLEEEDNGSTSSQTENEGSYTIKLTSRPTGTVTINLASSDKSVATVSPTSIQIAPNSWKNAHTVTVTAKKDNIDNIDEKRTASITHTLSAVSTDYENLEVPGVEVTVADDDAAPTAMTIEVDTNLSAGGNQNTVTEGPRVTPTIRVTAKITGVTRFGVAKTVAISFGKTADSATEGSDYTISDMNITLPAGGASASDTTVLTVVDNDRHEPSEQFSVEGTLVDVTVSGTSVTIDDNETKPTVTLVLTPVTISENDKTSTVTATLNGKSSEDMELTVAAAADTDSGASASDFSMTDNTVLTIAAGTTDSTGTVQITSIDNDIDAANKQVKVSATASGGNDISAPSQQILTITDDDTRGVDISIDAADNLKEEDDSQTLSKENEKQYEVVLTSEPTAEVTINVASADTTIATVRPISLTFDADDWDDPQTVTIEAVDDNIDNTDNERTTTITHAVSALGDYQPVTADSIAVTVDDDDVTPTAMKLTVDIDSVGEAAGRTAIAVTATITSATRFAVSKSVSVEVGKSSDGATEGTDYGNVSRFSITIPAGDASKTKSFNLTPINDTIDEIDEMVSVEGTLSGVSVTPASITITDNDATPTVTLNLSANSIAENGGSSRVTATLSGTSSEDVTLSVAATPVSPAVVGDFTLSEATTLTIAARGRSSSGQVSVTAVNNNVDAANKQLTISATAQGGNGVAAPASKPLTITDDDTRGISVTPTSVTMAEKDNTSTKNTAEHQKIYKVRLNSEPSGGTVTINTMSADSKVATVLPSALTFDSSDWSTEKTVVVTAVDDIIDNNGNARTTTITNSVSAAATDYKDESAESVSVTVNDDDAPPTALKITVAANSSAAASQISISEGASATTVDVTATITSPTRFAASKTVAVKVGNSGDTAAETTDYANVADFEIVIPAGAASVTKSFTLTPTDDAIDEVDEVLSVKGTLAGVTVTDASVKILDNEVTPTVTLSLSNGSISEKGGSSQLSASLSGVSSQAVTLSVTLRASSSASKNDLTLSGTMLTIPANSSNSNSITISAVDNNIDTDDKEFTVSAAATGGHGVSSPEELTLTIQDEDTRGITISATTLVLDEVDDASTPGIDEHEKTYTIVLDSEPTGSVTLDLDNEDDDAAVVKPLRHVFNSGNWDQPKVFTVTSKNDNIDNIDDRKTTKISHGVSADGTDYADETVADVSVTVNDDDATPRTIEIRVDTDVSSRGRQFEITEQAGQTAVEVTVVVLGNSRFAQAQRIDISVGKSDDTASAGVDYNTISGVVIRIPAGRKRASKRFNLTPINDTTNENNEEITVEGTGLDTPSLNVDSDTITITDDDGLPNVSLELGASTIGENAGSTTVTASLDRASGADITLTVAVTPVDPAVAGDFTLSSNTTLTIAAGSLTSTGTVSITAVDNKIDTSNKELTVSATATGGLGVEDPVAEKLEITDDDVSGVSISETKIEIDEVDDGDTAASENKDIYEIELDSEPIGTVTIDIRSDDTTVATVHPARITFDKDDWDMPQVITVTAEDDDIDNTDGERTAIIAHTVRSTEPDYVKVTAASVDVDVADVDAAPSEMTITVDTSTGRDGVQGAVDEGAGSPTMRATVAIVGDIRFDTAQTVAITFGKTSDSATQTADYSVSNFSVSIPAKTGSASSTFTFTVRDDDLDEPNEQLSVEGTLTDVVITGTAITIEDNDNTPTATLSLSPSPINESGRGITSTVTAALSSKSSEAVTIEIAATAGEDTASSDFTLSPNTTLTIAAGQTTSAGTVTITAVDNDVDAPDKEVIVSGTTTGGGVANPDSQTLTISDDDARGVVVSAATAGVSVEEVDDALTLSTNENEAAYTVVLTSEPSGGSVTIEIESEATTVATVSPASLTFTASNWNGAQTVTVTGIDDDIDNTDGARTTSITHTVDANDTDYEKETAGSVAVTVNDDEVLPTLTMSLTDASISENGGSTTITASLTGKSSEDITLNLSVSPSAGAAAGDLTLSGNTLTITADNTQSNSVTIESVNNDIDTANKEFTISATASGGNDISDPDDQTLTIEDDDERGIIVTPTALTVDEVDNRDTASVFENEKNYEVKLNSQPTGAVTVNITNMHESVVDVSATSLSFGPTDWKTAKSVKVTAVDDNIDNTGGGRTASITHSVTATNTDYNGEAASGVTVTVTDEDAPPTALTISVDTDSATDGEQTELAEDAGATTVTVTAEIDGDTRFADDKTVSITIGNSTDDDATEGTDYSATDVNLTLPAGKASVSGTFTLTPTVDNVDEPDETLTVEGSLLSGETVAAATITITDDNGKPTVSLVITDSDASISEDGGSTTITASLNGLSSQDVTLTVSTVAVSPAVSADFTQTGTTLTIAAGSTDSTGTVTIAAQDNDIDAANKTFTVSATATGGNDIGDPANQTLTITDDDERGVTVSKSAVTIEETDGGSSEHQDTYTVVLDSEPTGGTGTVTITPATGDNTIATFSPVSLTFTASNWNVAQTVTVTAVSDNVDNTDDERTTEITHTVSASGTDYSGQTVDSVDVTVNDDDGLPTVRLVLAPASIQEDGGSTSGTSTVTARMSGVSSEAVTLTVSAAADGSASASDITQSGTTLTIAARSTDSTGTVTIAAQDNDIDAANKTFTVSATATGGNDIGDPANQTLTITDDDERGVTVSKSAVTIEETDGGSSEHQDTYTVVLDSEPTGGTGTVTITPATGDNTIATFSPVSLTFTASNWNVAQTVTVTAVSDNVDNTDDERTTEITHTVSASGTDYSGQTVDSVDVTVNDDDGLPTVRLVLAPASIQEDGGSTSGTSTVTARMSGVSSEAVTLTVSAAADGSASASDITQSGTTLTIAARSTDSTGTVTIAAQDNDIDAANKTFTVSATATGGNDIGDPANQTLTITDDDERGVTVSKSAVTIEETDGGSSEHQDTYTVVLDSEPTGGTGTVTITPATGDNTIATFSPVSLTFTASNWNVAQTVTVTAVSDNVDNTDDERTTEITHTVSASGTDYSGQTVDSVDVTVNDDDGTPAVTLVLTPASIQEDGGSTSGTSTVKATLSGKSSAAVTVTVAAAAGVNTSAADFTVSTNKILTIAAGTTASSGTVTIAAVDNDVDAPNKSVTVSGTASGGGVSNPSDQTLAITDDEATPTVALILEPTTINESGSGNSSTVTATLSGKSHEAVTVEVAAAAGANASASDFTLSANKTLTIAAGSEASTGTVTIAVVDNDVDGPNKSVTVSGTATGGGVENPADQTLTIADDEGVPTVTLNLSANSIDESGNDNASTVTATLSGKASEAVEVVISVPDGAPVTQSGTTLTIAAGFTTSTGTVTITADDNDVDAANATVTVSGTASGGEVANPAGLTLTIEDDDERGVSVAAAPIVLDEADNAGTSGALEHQSTYTIELDSEPSGGSVTINLKVVDANVATIDETSVTFTASNWNQPQTITVQAVADEIDNVGNSRTTQITHTMSAAGTDYSVITSVPSIAVTVNDDDGTPVVSLVLAPLKINENGGSTSGVSTVTATMSGASSQQVSLTVSAAAVSPATGRDFQLAGSTLTIAAGSQTSTGTVTVSAVDNKADSDDKTITISAVASGGNGVNSPTSKTLTIEDDDVRGVSISKSTIKLSEADDAGTQNTKENQAQYTIELESQPTGGTVTVNIASGNSNVATVDKNTVQFTASDWNIPQSVTVTAVADSVDNTDNKRMTTISHTISAANTDYEDVNVDNVDITVDDDDGSPIIAIDNPQVTEGDGEDTKSLEFTVTLAPQSNSTVTVDFVDTGAGTALAGTDYEQFASGQLTFAPGEESKKIQVTVKPDSNDESDETIVIRLSNPVNAGFLGAVSTLDGTGTITDNDEAPSVSVSDAAAVVEGGDPQTTKEMTFEVSVDAVSVNEVIVKYQLSGTASPALDYLEPSELMVTIAPGTKTASITIPIKGDTIDEGLETIIVTLIQPSNANLSSIQDAAVATGNIIDDDFTISPELDTIYEDETLAYTVSGIESTYSSLKLKIGQASSASFGSDFKLLSGNNAELAENHSLTPVNGKIKFKVKALADNTAESDESIVLILEDSTDSLGVQLGVLALINGTRPVAGVDVSKTSITLVEGGSSGEYTLVLTKAPDPGTSVTITAASSLSSAVTVNAPGGTPGPTATLTFTEQNWNREQTVTVFPQLDDDTTDAQATITHSVTGSGSYASVTADSVEISVQDSGPVMMIVDAEADEGKFLEFMIELSAPSTGNVAVEWTTFPQTALANLDYEEVSGTVEFSEGEDSKMVRVFAMNDAVEEPPELFNVKLSTPKNTRLGRSSATGTIFDVRMSTKQWMARFGRTITEQVLDGIDSRIRYDGTQGIEGTFAGITFSDIAASHGTTLGNTDDMCGDDTWSATKHRRQRVLGNRCADADQDSKAMNWIDILANSSISSTEKHSYGEYSSIWAKGVKSGFDSKEGTVSLSGEVVTGMFGVDWSSEDSRFGVILSHSKGDGDIENEDGASAQVSSSITALVPWVSQAVSEQITLWGAVGYGQGDLTVGATEQDALTTDMDWTMVATGVRGKLIEAQEGSGFSLDFTSDAFWNRTVNDSAQGNAAEAAEVTRLRAAIEGQWMLQLDSDVTLKPKFELGGRYDGGDAETGFGVEFAGGIAWSIPSNGLEFALEGRSLITHEVDDFETWSYSAQLVYDAKPSTQRGLSSTIGYELDDGSTIGVDALFENGASTAQTENEIEGQWRFNVAYGYEMNNHLVIAKPNFSFAYSDSAREYKLGWQFIPVTQKHNGLLLEISVNHTEDVGERPQSSILLTIGGKW